MKNIHHARSRIHVSRKAREILNLGYLSCMLCPSVVGLVESNFLLASAAIPAGINCAFVTIIYLVAPSNTLDFYTFMKYGGLSFACLILFTSTAGFIDGKVNKKRDKVMTERSIQEESVGKMKPWVKDPLPNYDMNPLVACAVSSFYEGAEKILNYEEHNDKTKMKFEPVPKNPFVLLNETNVEIFKGDAEDDNEILTEIESLKTLTFGDDKRTCLRGLIRQNRYFDKTALMIAVEKKDTRMVKILLRKLPPKLLDQTDTNGKTACHYACNNALNDQELTKEVVKAFLELGVSPNFEIDLSVKDKTGQIPFDYLCPELKTEFASQYPQFFPVPEV